MEAQFQLSTIHYKKDSYIVVEGKQNADRFYIIQQGKVRVSKEVVVAEEDGQILSPGDFFGVISTMSSHSHIETAQAMTDVVLVTVLRDQYGTLIQKSNQVAMKIIMQFSRQLRYLNETLAGKALKKTAEIVPAHLFEVAEYYFSQKRYNEALYGYTHYLKYCPDGEHAGAAQTCVEELKTRVTGTAAEFGQNDVNRTYRKNIMFFAEGEPGEELFIIQKGSVKITKIVGDNEVLLAVLKAGDIFGEMALLEGKPRAATAVAYEDTDVMVVNRANFQRMIQTQPQLVTKVTTLLADRVWLIYKQLANTFIANPQGRMYDSLLVQLEKNRVPLDSQNPYLFSFGLQELTNMVGLTGREARQAQAEVMENKNIQIINDKMQVTTPGEILKMAEYFRKMDRIEKSRKETQS
ncbi:MAG: cyclic nucleotide-binding domain-containing protein [Treponema sp.]|jgi:CRP-like cAMP-binding protein|nr:cyclic nucleotide-binding domain-containing protein [Treponema sp.]